MLCGCGDKSHFEEEAGKTVEFYECILENASRRLPEVQDGMTCVLEDCLVRNWALPERFTVRGFGAWAHRQGSRIDAVNTVFWQDRFARPFKQFCTDMASHIGQAYNDEGISGLLSPSTYIPGVCRGLMASDGGRVFARNCWSNHWWIRLQNSHSPMEKSEALALVTLLDDMAATLDAEHPR